MREDGPEALRAPKQPSEEETREHLAGSMSRTHNGVGLVALVVDEGEELNIGGPRKRRKRWRGSNSTTSFVRRATPWPRAANQD